MDTARLDMGHGQPFDARITVTPEGRSLFCGFHDFCPWEPDGDRLLALEIDPNWHAMDDSAYAATLSLWDPRRGEITPIAATQCWNFQQAARQQWVAGQDQRIAYNTRDQRGDVTGVIHNILNGEKAYFQHGIYAVSPCGNWALTQDFARLARLWPAYGYRAARPSHHAGPETTGLWRHDITIGETRLLISLAQVLDEFDPNARADRHFLCHASIAPDGQNIVFLHRFFSDDGGLFTRLLSSGADGKNIRVLAEEKVSHFDWLDNTTLVVWARFSGKSAAKLRSSGALSSPILRPILNIARSFRGKWKKRLLNESYFTLPIDAPDARRRFAWPELNQDGHPMVARTHDWMVTDTYPDAHGMMDLILYHPIRRIRADLARVKHDISTSDTDAKCDLHPRWNRDESKIAVDVTEHGIRRIAIYDAAPLMKAHS